MSAQKGSAFLLKIGDGATPVSYVTVAGLRTTQMSITGDTVVVTSKDSGPELFKAWRSCDGWSMGPIRSMACW